MPDIPQRGMEIIIVRFAHILDCSNYAKQKVGKHSKENISDGFYHKSMDLRRAGNRIRRGDLRGHETRQKKGGPEASFFFAGKSRFNTGNTQA